MGIGEQVFGDAGTETGDAHVGRGPCAEAVDDGMEAGDTKVGGGTYSYVGVGAMTGLVLGDTGWDDGYLSRNQGQGGS